VPVRGVDAGHSARGVGFRREVGSHHFGWRGVEISMTLLVCEIEAFASFDASTFEEYSRYPACQ
jgi:hypothetical protein